MKIIANTSDNAGLDVGGSDLSGYPMVIWMTGDPTTKNKAGMDYLGGFFVPTLYRKDDKFYQFLPADADTSSYELVDLTKYGFTADYFVSETTANEVQGYWRRDLEAAFICGRKRWVVDTKEKKNNRPVFKYFTQYGDAEKAGSPRGQQQVLALIKGMEELGPFMFGFKGYSMKAFAGSGDYQKFGVIYNLQKNVTLPIAKKLTPKGQKLVNINFRSVWCKFGPHSENGKPIFMQAGREGASKMIAVPGYLGPVYDGKDIKVEDFYIGDDLQDEVDRLFDDNKDWSAAWSDLKGATDGDGAATEAATAEPSADDIATEAGI